ncbi:MAG: hypothetical protein IJB70_02640 [Clostridia bacterium]|nr:hypothetical protein [Clostridia bacterium]
MKSRKLKAILAALSAVAVMATAMTGFAATTTYDATTGKVSVKETVTADPDKEVTYLVKSNDQIVYIDQATANDAGEAVFEYKIAAGKLADDLSTTATFGTDGNGVTGGDSVLKLYGYKDDSTSFENCTVDYDYEIAGSEDTVTATLNVDDNYEIVSYTIDNGEKISFTTKAVTLTNGQKITAVETKKTYVAPTINAQETVVGAMEDDSSLGETYKAITTVISYTGDFTDGAIGVICGDYYYPAKVAKDGKAAVKLILPEGSKDVKVEAYANTNN